MTNEDSDHGVARILADETGRPIEDFIPDLDKYPLPDLEELEEVNKDE